MSPAPADYVDVATRIQEFYDRYPDGSLQTEPPQLLHVGDKTYVFVQAAAYRTADDKKPGIGTAWEPVPGPTPFTKDSELQNAETSAWGRAIVALGFETKHIASSNEVRNRQAAPPTDSAPTTPTTGEPTEPTSGWPRVSHLLEALEEALPTQDGQNSHNKEIRLWSEDKFGKKAADFDLPEVEQVIAELERRLAEADIPFEGEAA